MKPTVRIDLEDPTPPYEQLRRQFALYIETGQLLPDERLPPLRQLARDLGLAAGTVARAYRELEGAGLIRSRRGAGTRVLALALPQAASQHRLDEAALVYAQTTRALGMTPAQARQALETALATVNTPAEADGST
jgi:DNA-binding transcriptional regulator YhcF (GntR family)